MNVLGRLGLRCADRASREIRRNLAEPEHGCSRQLTGRRSLVAIASDWVALSPASLALAESGPSRGRVGPPAQR
jgi:hypothetical protein